MGMSKFTESDARALSDALWGAPVDADLGFRENCDEMAEYLTTLGYRLPNIRPSSSQLRA